MLQLLVPICSGMMKHPSAEGHMLVPRGSRNSDLDAPGDPGACFTQVSPALERAGLEVDLGTHSLRRSQVDLLIAQGEHPKVIADRLGHSSVRTVLDVYGHLYEGADEAAAERLDEQIASYAHPKRVKALSSEYRKRRKPSSSEPFLRGR
jgi:integrase